MAGILLSGWRIRLFDSAGNPLYPGRVEFFDATTSLPKTVYADKDLTIPLGTSTTTDLEGYLPAIWLSDGYYKGIVSQRIQADPETWNPLWTINHLGKELASTGAPGSGVMAYCENIAELKAIEAGTIDGAIVAGYYESGDCGEPLFFTWNASSTKTDDAGAYIRSNDTPSGTAGRYHQTFPTGVLDIRKWGGLPNETSIDCTGALVNMSNYACDFEVYPVTPPEIGFVAPGVYYFSGNTNLNRIWKNASETISKPVPYYVGNGAQIACGSQAITFTNPVRIESDFKIVEYPTSYSFGAGSVDYLRPQWLPDWHGNLANKITAAHNEDLPVRVYGVGTEGAITLDQSIEWVKNNPIYFDSPDIYFTVASGDTYNIQINCPIFIPNNQYIFRCSTLILNNNDINAKWFGWGYLSGTDQAPALQSAINASNGQAVIVVPQLTNSTHRLNSAVNGYAHQYEHTINIEGTIIFGTSGSLINVYLEVPWNQFCISATTANNIKIMNPTISPAWFGARSVSTRNSVTALSVAINVGARGRNIIDGGGAVFYVSRALSFDFTSITNPLCSLKNITINITNTYNTTTNPILLTISGPADCELESVNLNATNKGVKPLYLNTYWSRVRNCYFGNDVIVADGSEDYVFTNNQIYGEIEGCSFYSASKGAIITGNTFTQCRVHLIGDKGIQTGYNFPMLQNMIVSNNIFNNLDGSYFKGCVYVIAYATNTLVNGLNITNNVFAGNIPALSNSGEDPDDFYRYRIHNVLWGSGTWAVSQQPNNDVRHMMVIKDNTYQWFDPYRDAPTPEYPYNTAGHRQNYLPSTSGTESVDIRTLTGTVTVNGLIRDTFTITPDPRNIFMLVGDTTSQFTANEFIIRGWRRKTGTNTWANLQPCQGAMSVLGLKANTSGTATIDIQRTQYEAVAGSGGWAGSSVHYGFTWKIYEAY